MEKNTLIWSYCISLLYPFQYSDNMGYAFLLALYKCSLWATVAVHIHLRDKCPAIPVHGTDSYGEKVRQEIIP